MAIAHHITFGMYGFWLPNDPRGSWSDYIFAKHLLPFGNATKVNTRQSRAHDPHDHRERLEAKKHLQFSPVKVTGEQSLDISRGFKQVVADTGLRIFACAIMPDQVHSAIQYVRQNPVRDGLREQHWSFVVPFE